MTPTMRRCKRPECGFEFAVTKGQGSKIFCSDYCRDIITGWRRTPKQRGNSNVLFVAGGLSQYQQRRSVEVVHPNAQTRVPEEPYTFKIDAAGKALPTYGKRHDR